MVILILVFMGFMHAGSTFALQKNLQLVPAEAPAEKQFTLTSTHIHCGGIIIVSVTLLDKKTVSLVRQDEQFLVDDAGIIKKDYLSGQGRSFSSSHSQSSHDINKLLSIYAKAHTIFLRYKYDDVNAIIDSLAEGEKTFHFNESDLPLELVASTQHKAIENKEPAE